MWGLCALAPLTVWKMSTPPSTLTLSISVIQVMNTPLRDMPSLKDRWAIHTESMRVLHVHTHTHTYTHTHSDTYTWAHEHIHTCSHMQLFTWMHDCIHKRTHIYWLTRTWPSEVPWSPSASSPLDPSSSAWSQLEDGPPLARSGSGTGSPQGKTQSSANSRPCMKRNKYKLMDILISSFTFFKVYVYVYFKHSLGNDCTQTHVHMYGYDTALK